MKRIRRRTYLNMCVRILLLLFVTVFIVSSTVLLGQRRRSGEENDPIDTTKPGIIITQFMPNLFTPRTMGGLVAGSDLVIEGIVTDMLGSYLNGPNKMGAISTETEITIRNVLGGKGRGPGAPETVTVRLTGGKVGEAHEIIRDQPPFELGEEYVLFLERIVGEQREVYQPIGFSRGRFKVINNRVYPTVLTDFVGRHHVGKDLDLFVAEIVRSNLLPRTQSFRENFFGSAGTLPELTDQVPTIVRVVVTDLLVTYYWPGTDVREGHYGSLIVTDIEVVVTNSIKGEFVEGDSLVVHATQGTLDQVTQVTDPITPDMKVGEGYILFLLPESNVADNQLPLHGIPRFFTMSGSLGRFRVEGGLIKQVNPESELHQEFKDRPVDEFVEAILENVAGRPQ